LKKNDDKNKVNLELISLFGRPLGGRRFIKPPPLVVNDSKEKVGLPRRKVLRACAQRS